MQNLLTEDQIRQAALMAIQAIVAQAIAQNVPDALSVGEHIRKALEFYHQAHPL